MQLIIESKAISDINMSTLEEPQDERNAVITDMKREIQIKKDDIREDGASEVTAEKDADAEKLPIIEAKTNGDIDTSNVNGIGSPNDNKENNAPQIDFSLVYVPDEEESIESITNCVNSLFGLTKDSKLDSPTEKVETDETHVQNDSKIDDSVKNDSGKEDDMKMEIDLSLENDKLESPSVQLLNKLPSKTSNLNDAANGDIKQDTSSTEISESLAEIETTVEMEVDPNSSVECQPTVEENSHLEDTNKNSGSEDISLDDAVSHDVDKIQLQENATNNDAAASNDEEEIPLLDKATDNVAPCQKPNENSTENTGTSNKDINNPLEKVSDCQPDINNILDNYTIANDRMSSEVSVASPSKAIVDNDTISDVVLALCENDNNITKNATPHINTPTMDSTNDISEKEWCDSKNDAKEIELVQCEKVNDITENEAIYDPNSSRYSCTDITEDKLVENENDTTEIDLAPCEKVNDITDNETSHDNVSTIRSSDEILKNSFAVKKNVVNDIDLVPSHKLVDNVTKNETLYEDTPIDSTTVISEKTSPDQNDDSLKESLPEDKENMPNNKSKDVTDTTSIKHKESDLTCIGLKNGLTENAVPDKNVTGGEKEPVSINISCMKVDGVEFIHEKDNTENLKKTIENTQDNNIIEILDQDPTEIDTKIGKGIINESLDTKPDVTFTSKEIKNKDEISDEDDIKIIEEIETEDKKEPAVKVESKPLVVCKLSNTLDILSDDDDGEEEPAEPPAKKAKIEEKPPPLEDKQCINLDDDDDIMLIEDMKETPVEPEKPIESDVKKPDAVEIGRCEKETKTVEEPPLVDEKENDSSPQLSVKEPDPAKEAIKEPPKPLLPMNVLKSAKKNLSEMTRDELEEFCILKIVESIVDRSSLSEIKKKMKVIEQNMEEYKKKTSMLSKQNRDLQVVLKSVQEEQKNRPSNAITPLKITRSVGMQVLMLDKTKKKMPGPVPQNNTNTPKQGNRTPSQTPKTQKSQNNNQNIPVPKLIPASPAKIAPSSPMTPKPQTPNGIRNTPSPAQKTIEKRPLTRQSIANTSNAGNTSNASNSMTVDLTDDDPPAKVTKSSPVPPVRLVPSQNLMAPRPQTPASNSRKVFIPINGPGQTVILKNLNQQQMGPRGRFPVPRMPQNQVRMAKVGVNRHPAALPDVMKQYQPPTWKALPPAPDLKLAKVDNGIVISWKIEGYQEDSYEKIASFQLYAYQETSTPPSTALWKKIGDVKALPLPMACTLTQFMAGFKYYFAVRAVDVKSRLGPFSLPGSILLLNKI